MAEPKKETVKLNYMDGPLDTSTPDVSFMGSMATDTLSQVKKWIDATDPASVKLAGLYYSRSETLLNGFAADLKTKATELAEHYTGPAAIETQKQLQSLHASVRELAKKLGEMGRPLQGYADTLQWAQANVVENMDHDSRSDHDVDWAGRIPFYRLYRGDKRAVDHLKKVNERIVEHYKQLPPDVQQALPDPGVPEIPAFNNGGGDVPNVPGLGDLGNGNGSGDYDNASFNPGSMPDGPGSPDTSAPGDGSTGTGAGTYPSAQYPSDSGAGGSGGVGDPYGGSDTSGLTDTTLGGAQTPTLPSSSTPSSSDNGTTTLAGYDPSLSAYPNGMNPTTTGPGSGGPGLNGGTGTGPSAGAGSGAGAGYGGVPAAGAGRAGANGMGMMPMGGAGAGGRGEENSDRESTTWLVEDDDVWGGPEGTTPSTLT